GYQVGMQTTISSQSLGAVPGGAVTFNVNGNAVPGGIFYSGTVGSFSSPTATLNANLSPSSSPFPVPGTYSINAAYAGDGNYVPVTSSPTNITVKFAPPSMRLIASANPVQSGATLTLTATIVGWSKTIAPTGTITFGSTTTTNLAATVSYSTVTDPNGNLDLQGVISFIPIGSDTYNASYSGD